jgi:hypothetical protein
MTCQPTGEFAQNPACASNLICHSRYMRIAGFAAEGLRSERMVHESFPVKELQDYWSTRPRFEETAEGAGSASGSSSGSQTFQAWESSQGGPATDEPAPPPYSLEAEQAAPSAVNPPPPQPTSQQHSVAVSGITDAFAAASLGRAGSFGASGPVAAASSAAPLEPRAQDVRPLLSTPHTSSGGRTSSSEYSSAYTPPSSRPQMENPGMYRPVSCDEPGSGSTGFVPSPGAYKDTSTPSHVSASSPTSPYASPPISSPHIPGVSVPHAYPIHQPSYPSPNGYPPQTNSFHNPPLSTPGVPFMPYGGNPAGQSYMPGPANTPYVTSGPYHHQVPTQPYAATHGPYGQPSPQQYMPPQAAPGLNPYYSADSQHHAPYASGPGNVCELRITLVPISGCADHVMFRFSHGVTAVTATTTTTASASAAANDRIGIGIVVCPAVHRLFEQQRRKRVKSGRYTRAEHRARAGYGGAFHVEKDKARAREGRQRRCAE